MQYWSQAMKKSKKICIFTGFFIPHLGGVERYTQKLASELHELGNEVIIVASNDNNYSTEEDLGYCHVYHLPVHNLFKNRYPLLKKNKEYKEIIAKLENEKIDYYMCNTRFYMTSLLCAKLAKKHNKPFTLIEHGSDHLSIGNKFWDFWGRIYEHTITKMIKKHDPKYYGVSKRSNNWLKHFDITASGTFYNSVDSTLYDKYKKSKYKRDFKGKTVITFVGRIIKEKGVLLLLDAFNNCKKDFKDIVLVIAGDGPLLEQIRKEYASDDIFFEGKLNYEEVMALLNETDIFVNPSMYPEGLPTTILEAGIMKCAIIATDRGGTKEVITDDKIGIIMEENQESLEENLRVLLEDEKKLNKLKENVHKRVLENFTWEPTAKYVIEELKKNER